MASCGQAGQVRQPGAARAPQTETKTQEECPYTFSDSPAYVARKKAEDQAKRAVELEGKAETRGFLQNIEELAKKHKWSDVHQVIERRTAVPSGLFLITRAAERVPAGPGQLWPGQGWPGLARADQGCSGLAWADLAWVGLAWQQSR